MSFFVTAGLLLCIQTPGSSAVTRVFVQKGKDVLLEVPISFAPQKRDILTWRFNAINTLVRFFPPTEPDIIDDYVGRVSVTNYSVKLKNLQAADSGVYDARVSGATERKLVEYNITVQVSPVKLNVDSVLSSSDSCIINATCSTSDSDISSTFRCVHKTCNQDGGEQSETTNSGASLRIYLSDVLIFCNHSNQVSWTENMIEIQDFCLQPAGKTNKRNNFLTIINRPGWLLCLGWLIYCSIQALWQWVVSCLSRSRVKPYQAVGGRWRHTGSITGWTLIPSLASFNLENKLQITFLGNTLCHFY
uniref:Immunoglobulin subtype domain-containing protein n=1 Tax=Amphiprion percula TaxID=161767 RepID=A0A3P8TN68_AMPPE